MQMELYDIMAKARSLDELLTIEPMAQEVCRKYMLGLEDADVRELAIHRRLSRVNYSRRCAEASAVQAYQKRGLPLAPGMEIGYVVTDATKWEVDIERNASEFDAGYYGTLLGRHGMRLRLYSMALKGRFGSHPIIDFCMHRQV
jgi:DNA polymerase, archaea type